MNTQAVLRYSLGSTLIATVAFVYAWPLSYLLPVLSLGFLAPQKKALSFSDGMLFFLVVSLSVIFGILVSFFSNQPVILFLLMGLSILHIFYTNHPFMNQLLKTWMIIALLLLPMMNLMYPGLSIGVATALVAGVAGTVVMIWLVFAIFPDKETNGVVEAKSAEPITTDLAGKNERFRTALESTLVVLPILILFYVFEWSGSLLVLIFVGIFSMQPGMANFQVGKALVIGNLMGGLIAIAVFNLLVIVPYLNFMITLLLLVAFYCGYQFFSGKKTSPLFNMAFSTFMLIIGSTMSATDVDPGSKVWTRIIQMAIAVTYVVLAFQFIERWKKFRMNKKKKISLL